jgi:hypothetical protein
MPRAVPAHPACHGVRGGCAVCTCHLHARRNCLAGATSTVACSLCAEAADLQVCDLWRKFDKTSRLSALQGWNGGERQDPEERPVTPRLGVPRNPEYDIIWQLLAFQRDAGLAAHPNCTKRQHPGPEQRCPLCPRMFPRTARDGPCSVFQLPVPHDRGRSLPSLLRHDPVLRKTDRNQHAQGKASPPPSRPASRNTSSECRATFYNMME